MFTGIISDIGTIHHIEKIKGQDMMIEIATHYDLSSVLIGASIAHNGICLTIIEKNTINGKYLYRCQLSAETLSRTTAGNWHIGQKLNLERALRLGDELGGNIVLGHIDQVIRLQTIEQVDGSRLCVFELPKELSQFIVEKGSVVIDGVALTVNKIDDKNRLFSVNIIPHTWKNTIFQDYSGGTLVNFEIDPLARYGKNVLEKLVP